MEEEWAFLPEIVDTTPKIDPWIMLVVDDDESIHAATKLCLNGCFVLGKPVKLLHAMSRKEGFELFEANADKIVLVLIDVIMETTTAGLDLARDIRELPAGKDVRLLIRTGQPGLITDEVVVEANDINGYLSKTEMTRTKLLAVLALSLRDRETIAGLMEQVRILRENRITY